VLFSEPKIPQRFGAIDTRIDAFTFQCSSASRKFLNGHKPLPRSGGVVVSVLFSEPKIPQPAPSPPPPPRHAAAVSVLFSEPKIPQLPRRNRATFRRNEFQCSSASRKFLNRVADQRRWTVAAVSVLFSEPKIPQPSLRPPSGAARAAFQCSSASRKFLNTYDITCVRRRCRCFSALQRAENSSTICVRFCDFCVI